MIASASSPQERLSQLLPTVKCSTCLQPVPLTDLGDHACAPPPPVPAIPKIPTTATMSGHVPARSVPHDSSPSNNNRLRINTVARGPPSPTQSAFRSSPLARVATDRLNTSSPRPRDPNSDLNKNLATPTPLRIRTPSNSGGSSNQSGSTPATARPQQASFSQQQEHPGPSTYRGPPGLPTGPAQGIITPPRGHPQPTNPNGRFPPPTNVVSFPRGPPPPGGYNSPPQGPAPIGLPRRPGQSGNIGILPRIPGGPPGGLLPPPGPGLPSSFPPVVKSEEAFVPPGERGINTSSGGEAGMAGVGRRGFAAATRAYMLAAPVRRPMGPQPQPQYNRRPSAPNILELDTAARSTETPPLSAGSGYSSHSPGPVSPLQQVDFPNPNLNQPSAQIQRTPSPQGQYVSTPTPTLAKKPPLTIPLPPPPPLKVEEAAAVPPSPRLPFFERFKNKLPGMTPTTDRFPGIHSNNNNVNALPTPVSDSSSSGYGRPGSSVSGSTSSFVAAKPLPNAPSSSASGSDYSGLAYANSTDREDDEERRGRKPTLAMSMKSPPLTQAMLRSMSNGSKVQFGSVSDRSRSNESGGRRSLSRVRTEKRVNGARGMVHSRDNSLSSYSSNADSEPGAARESVAANNNNNKNDDQQQPQPQARQSQSRPPNRDRSNSLMIAQALGLSQKHPSEYARLGGPGVYNVEGRIARSTSGSSSGNKAGFSRTGGGGPTGEKSEEVPPLPNTAIKSARQEMDVGSSSSSVSCVSKSEKKEKEKETETETEEEGGNVLQLPVVKAQRSNTMQSTPSPDLKTIKLPMRAQSEREKDRGASASASAGGGVGAGTGGGLRKERKYRVCLKCVKPIEDGRWVSSDGGGILCERCWKNMYLPKCRRCNLTIEKQAVSSADGQLKGKYHKECFNCHKCHQSFPDKTFYVYDGKPLCAYHYHEANDSLCAAARCGQPIEGPCAVSHTGDRYHPEHMTCEYPGVGGCGERLSEYWEVDGRMLCERHAVSVSRFGSVDGESEEEGVGEGRGWEKRSKGMKRVTRFIDLTGGAGLNPPAAAAGIPPEGRRTDSESSGGGLQ